MSLNQPLRGTYGLCQFVEGTCFGSCLIVLTGRLLKPLLLLKRQTRGSRTLKPTGRGASRKCRDPDAIETPEHCNL